MTTISFKVKNTTDELITKILVSEDGEEIRLFRHRQGNQTRRVDDARLDKSTNSSSCHQYLKAVWESGKEGQPVKFDFCEKGLELEF